MSGSPRTERSGVWARFDGVTLVRRARDEIAAQPELVRALTDGHDRAAEGSMPEAPEGTRWFEIREDGETHGVAAVVDGCPREGESALIAVAVGHGSRGQARATKALLAAERRLIDAEGRQRMVTRVPRTNGRGLYFMLRCGFTPLTGEERPSDEGDATWFARAEVGG